MGVCVGDCGERVGNYVLRYYMYGVVLGEAAGREAMEVEWGDIIDFCGVAIRMTKSRSAKLMSVPLPVKINSRKL